jgi:mRNA interferase HigB
MRVHLIKRLTIEEFSEQHARSKPSLGDWLEKVKNADWDEPSDITETFNSADLLGNGSSRVVFNIAGNNFRMICKYAFGEKQVHLFVCWMGTHTEYTALCDKNEQFTKSIY